VTTTKRTDMPKIKREIIEWIVMIAVFLGLYLTGMHTQVIGMIQRVVLAPGLIKPEILSEEDQLNVSYDFNLLDAQGETVSFTNFKGKTVFLNLWATWCPPCIAEMPDINDLYGKVDLNEVAFVMISRDDDYQKALSFANKKGYDFPVYAAASRLPQVFQTNSIPTTFIISPEGKLVAKRKGMAKYDSEEFRNFLIGLNKKSGV
jgi:thiol-disulfide isomerase/thioredoxin